MSFSTNSTNCGDDFTPAENEKVNGNAICLDNDGKFDGKNSEQSVTDQQQQLKEFREKFAKMEMELKMAKLELENKEQKLKHQELMVEQMKLKEKWAKIEQEKKNIAVEEQFTKMQNVQRILLEKISELEKQQKATSDQFSEMQNDRKILLKKISQLKKEPKQRKALLNFQQNYWDANDCDENLEIIGEKNLIVHYKGDYKGWRSVFAQHQIWLGNNFSDIFYYEISIEKMNDYLISFGFAIIQQTDESYQSVRHEKDTYAYESNGCVWINGERKGSIAEYSYCIGDTVGIGVNSITRQIFFTKNGLRLDFSDFFVPRSFARDPYYPFVTLATFGDKIEANFVPIFKFDLETRMKNIQ